jgi:hypothetical protein
VALLSAQEAISSLQAALAAAEDQLQEHRWGQGAGERGEAEWGGKGGGHTCYMFSAGGTCGCRGAAARAQVGAVGGHTCCMFCWWLQGRSCRSTGGGDRHTVCRAVILCIERCHACVAPLTPVVHMHHIPQRHWLLMFLVSTHMWAPPPNTHTFPKSTSRVNTHAPQVIIAWV